GHETGACAEESARGQAIVSASRPALPRPQNPPYILACLHEQRTGPLMQPVSILLNILWILIGGAWMAFGWLIAAVIMAITIIGIPWARAAFNIAVYTLVPFGSRAVPRDMVTGVSDVGTGPLGVIGNIIWFVLAG